MNSFIQIDTELDIHPACYIAPEMTPEEYADFLIDIRSHGLREPIVLFEGMILDGRHRYRACMELGIEPAFVEWSGGSSDTAYVLSQNLHRRHLTASQRAMMIAKAKEYHSRSANERQKAAAPYGPRGGAPTIKQRLEKEFSTDSAKTLSVPGTLTRSSDAVEDDVISMFSNGKASESMARVAKVSPSTVERGLYVIENGTPEDVHEVESGRSSVKAKAAEIKARKPSPSSASGTTVALTVSQWDAMSPEEQRVALSTVNPRAGFNDQKDVDGIEWAAYSWNPVTGCEHDCPYCYARDIANRFYGEVGFTPALYPERLSAPANRAQPGKRNNRVFTCSMADLFGQWVPTAWIQAVLDACQQAPQFDFLLLTKNPRRLTEFAFPANCWVGTTTDTQQRMTAAERIFKDITASVKWVSVEPMMEPILPSDASAFDWYVIGGASPTTSQTGFVPPFEWVARLATAAYAARRSVFVKTNFWEHGRPQQVPGSLTL